MFQLSNAVVLSFMWVLSIWNIARRTGQWDFKFHCDFGQGDFGLLQYHGVKHSICTICYWETVRNIMYWISPSTQGTKVYILITSASITCTLKFVKLCLKYPRKSCGINQRYLGYSVITASSASNWLKCFSFFFFFLLMLLVYSGSAQAPFNIILPLGPRLVD